MHMCFKMKFVVLPLFLMIVPIFYAEECSSDQIDNCQDTTTENKYSAEANTKHLAYLRIIDEANKSYIPCDNKNCKCYSAVIKNDLKAFNEGISQNDIKNVRSKGTKYQIINRKLYRDKECMFPARCTGIEHFLLELIDELPDSELIINTRDWPQIHKQFGPPGPVFSFSKTTDYLDIMYPAWAFWEGGPAISLYPTGIGRWDRHRQELGKIGNETAWDLKLNKGFFRGSRTSSERDALVLLSRKNPNLVDAQYTKNQAWKSNADTLDVPPAAEVPFKDHCKYKYLFNFRGVAASFRFKHILLCKSLVFHVGDEWLEFFYPALKPWIHYVPIKANAKEEEIKSIMEFMMKHDDVAKQIAENGYNMIWNNLKMKDVLCYWRKIIKKYTNLLKFKPVIDKDLIEIRKK